VDHVVCRKVTQTVKVVEITIVGQAGSLLGLLVFLDVSLRVRQVTSSSRVTTADRTLLKVALQDVTSGKGVATEDTHVWAVTGVSQKMALEMLGMEVSLGTVRTREFAIRSLTGITVFLVPVPAAGAAGRPGALGRIPRRPWEPTTWVGGSPSDITD